MKYEYDDGKKELVVNDVDTTLSVIDFFLTIAHRVKERNSNNIPVCRAMDEVERNANILARHISTDALEEARNAR